MRTVTFCVPMEVVGKPRQTQRDKWKKRDIVMRYRQWADELRLRAPKDLPTRPRILKIHATIPMPKTWTLAKKKEKLASLHDEKPDADNIAKAVCDVLFTEDKTIGALEVRAYWIGTDEKPETMIEVTGEDL